ncbi:conserved hypothetical protein [Candidatus Zixiibacteriota bacterium]|nr:conserved hypothetical protein [candidate division Zixibacteria bacterium]
MTLWQTTIWGQFGAAIDTLENAMSACPESLWGDRSRKHEYWYMVFHTLFWLDYYMSDSVDGFAPPAPFGLEEMDPAGVLPERVYSKEELFTYLKYGRRKCQSAILALNDDFAHLPCGSKRPGLTNADLLLYTMRHVQHHAAQLNLILRQTIDAAPRWVAKTTHILNE